MHKLQQQTKSLQQKLFEIQKKTLESNKEHLRNNPRMMLEGIVQQQRDNIGKQ